MLDLFSWCYAQDYPIDDETIHHCYEKLEPAFESLTNEKSSVPKHCITVSCI